MFFILRLGFVPSTPKHLIVQYWVEALQFYSDVVGLKLSVVGFKEGYITYPLNQNI